MNNISSFGDLNNYLNILNFFKSNENKLKNHFSIINFLFCNLTLDQVLSRQVVIYGSGRFGRQVNKVLRLIGVEPLCFASSFSKDNEPYVDGLKVLNINHLYQIKHDVIILIASPSNAAHIKKLLLATGFSFSNIYLPQNVDPYTELYFGDGNYQVLRSISQFEIKGQSIEQLILEYSKLAENLNGVFVDQLSNRLLWAIVVQTLFWNDIGIFRMFMSTFSEPIKIFGTRPYADNGPENYFYFNNEIFNVNDDEVFIDIGAFDGDSINEFILSNKIRNFVFRKIIAFEPDPINYLQLKNNIHTTNNIILENLGVSDKCGTTRFMSSLNSTSPTGSNISNEGDIEVQLVSLDDYLNEDKVSIIKMDPPGEHISCNILDGAIRTIKKHQPTIIIRIHSLKELHNLVNKVKNSFDFYDLYLRHNSWGAGEVDLYLIPKLHKQFV